MSITNLRAHYADGQVWIIWTPSPVPPTDAITTWEIYASDSASTPITDGNLVAKMFDQDCLPEMLMQVSGLSNFKIPNGSGGTMAIPDGDRLFVKTVRNTRDLYYTVTGDAGVTFASPVIVSENFSLSEPPKPHLQGGEDDGDDVRANYFYLWVDGDQNLAAGRPDFEVMANQHRKGCPHLFIIYARNDHDFTVPAPMTVALHGGGGYPDLWRPSNRKVRKINTDPGEQFTLAHADRINVRRGGPQNPRVAWKEMGWFGYRPSYDPFVFPNPPANEDEVIVNYSQKRILWINNWMIETEAANPNKIALCGYSAGSSGSLRLSKTHPNVWSTVTLFCQGFRSDGGDDPSAFHGSTAQNLRTNIIGNNGMRIRWTELSNYTTLPEPMGEYPLVRVLCGINDRNGAMHWDRPSTTPVHTRYQEMDAVPYGFHLYWDERGHGWDTWNDHWCDLNDQTGRDDFAYQVRYANNLSYPGFFNHQAYSSYDPTQDDWGTWGGYIEWADIVDTADEWACTVWLIDNMSSPNLPDNSPHAQINCDLIIRRRQQFMTGDTEMIYWKIEDDSQVVLQSGDVTTTDSGDIIFTDVFVRRDPNRVRLFLSKTPF